MHAMIYKYRSSILIDNKENNFLVLVFGDNLNFFLKKKNHKNCVSKIVY